MKLRVPKRSTTIDEEVVTPTLIKHWRNNYDAMAYLNKRFVKGDATGDFLKSIINRRKD
jgi:hypothetical protein